MRFQMRYLCMVVELCIRNRNLLTVNPMAAQERLDVYRFELKLDSLKCKKSQEFFGLKGAKNWRSHQNFQSFCLVPTLVRSREEIERKRLIRQESFLQILAIKSPFSSLSIPTLEQQYQSFLKSLGTTFVLCMPTSL